MSDKVEKLLLFYGEITLRCRYLYRDCDSFYNYITDDNVKDVVIRTKGPRIKFGLNSINITLFKQFKPVDTYTLSDEHKLLIDSEIIYDKQWKILKLKPNKSINLKEATEETLKSHSLYIFSILQFALLYLIKPKVESGQSLFRDYRNEEVLSETRKTIIDLKD